MNRLTVELMAAIERHDDVRTFDRAAVQHALVAILAEFPRYRAYVPEDAPAQHSTSAR